MWQALSNSLIDFETTVAIVGTKAEANAAYKSFTKLRAAIKSALGENDPSVQK